MLGNFKNSLTVKPSMFTCPIFKLKRCKYWYNLLPVFYVGNLFILQCAFVAVVFSQLTVPSSAWWSLWSPLQVLCLDMSWLCGSWSVAHHTDKAPVWWTSSYADLHDADLVPFKSDPAVSMSGVACQSQVAGWLGQVQDHSWPHKLTASLLRTVCWGQRWLFQTRLVEWE